MRGVPRGRQRGFQKGNKFGKYPIKKEKSSEKSVSFQRLTSSKIDVVQNKPFDKPRTLDEYLEDSHSAELRLLRPKKEPHLKVEENNEIPIPNM